jgi:hypothetical protein
MLRIIPTTVANVDGKRSSLSWQRRKKFCLRAQNGLTVVMDTVSDWNPASVQGPML